MHLPRLPLAPAAILAAVAAAAPALAQPCTPEWLPGNPIRGVDGSVYALTSWDPDGDGPLPMRLIAGGYFNAAGSALARRIAMWDGESWHALGDGLSGTVYALTTFDPDGPGPQPALLIAGGSFTVSGGVALSNIAAWDGSAWSPLGSGITGARVNSLITYDADGDGPLPPRLIAGGDFTHAGGFSIRNLAAWNGASWNRVGGQALLGPDSPVQTLAVTHAPSGDARMLIVGGDFTSLHGITANRIAAFNGSTWSPLAGGFPQRVAALTEFDFDGPGPEPARLVAGGDSGAAAWDGLAWQQLGASIGNVLALASFDPDSDGPLPPSLIATRAPTQGTSDGLYTWDGAAWANDPQDIREINALHAADLDGPGGAPNSLFCGGSFSVTDPNNDSASNIASWDGAAWSHLSPDLGSSWAVWAMTIFDFDGAGPEAPSLVAGGPFQTFRGMPVSGAVRLNGSTWTPVIESLSIDSPDRSPFIYSVGTFDLDGDGPAPERLIVAGDFDHIDGQAIDHVAQYDGTTWSPLGSPDAFLHFRAGGLGLTYTVFDADGPGPAAAELIMTGQFQQVDGVAASSIARWNGSTWNNLGGPVSGNVGAATVFDFDGPGPQLPELVAAGSFTSIDGVPANRIARWNGSAWSPIGDGFNGTVRAIAGFDPDGPGPQPEQLIAGGYFTASGTTAASRIAVWDGAAWSPLGGGVDYLAPFTVSVSFLHVVDLDGQGPDPERLIASGFFDHAGGVPTLYNAIWDGTNWAPMIGGGLGSIAWSMRAFDPDGGGPLPTDVFACGSITTAGAHVSAGIARYGCLPPECSADWDGNTLVNSNDISAYLTAWLADVQNGTTFANFNGDGPTNSNDISAFLTAWLDALQNGC